MVQKRTNKYPNNRFDNNNVKRIKKITPHITKNKTDKPNRNGFVKETIPGKTEYFLRAPKATENTIKKNNFFQNIFSKDGYYNYLWIPVILLLLTIILDFSLQFAVYSNLNPYYVSLAKDSMFFMMFSAVLLCVNIGAFIYIGLQTAKHNLNFIKALKTTLKIVLIILIIETIFTIIAYFSFLSPYIQNLFVTNTLRGQYLLYLVIWNVIKSIIYMLMVSISYLLFFKLKFV